VHPDSEDEYLAVREEILDAFGAWGRSRDIDVHEVGLMLDFKWGYADGLLALWTVEDVEQYLHAWYPAKVLADPEDAPGVTRAMSAFFEYLQERDLMDPGSSSVKRLQVAVRRHEQCLADGLANPAMRGPAGAIAAAMAADGVDMTDQDAVKAWIDEFNAGPIEQRDAILGRDDQPPAPPPPPTLIPRPVPLEDDLRTSAEAAPILKLLDRFAEYIGEGRNLTQTGNLKLADAGELVRILETGEHLETRIGSRTFRTQSAADLRILDLVFKWAKRARAVRVARGRLYATKTWPKLRRDPVAALNQATDVILENGLLEAFYGWWGSEAGWNVMDDLLPFIFARLYDRSGPEEYKNTRDAVVSSAEARVRFPEVWTRRMIRDHLTRQADYFFEVLEMTGAVTRRDVGWEPQDWGPPRKIGGVVELSPYGRALVQRWLPTIGWVVPVVPRFEVTTGDPPEDIASALADMLEASGPVAMLEALDTLGKDGLQQVLIDRLWRVDDDRTIDVLSAIGRHHLSTQVAKAARTAARKHQSWRAGR
jgi:hypothetical protein